MSVHLDLRLALSGYIYGIELDLRDIILQHIIPYKKSNAIFTSTEQFERVSERYLLDYPSSDLDSKEADMIQYIDFGDATQIIAHNKQVLSKKMLKEFMQHFNSLENIAKIRNRALHGRPLRNTDYPDVIAFVLTVLGSESQNWKNVREIKIMIENDPSLLMKLNIQLYTKKESDIYNNLPRPDFDETGFIGRINEQKQVLKNLKLGTKQVVSIIGEGGIGKTALLLHAIYSLLDLPKSENPFDMIIWLSSKTSILTNSGIKSIASTIKSFDSMVGELADEIDQKRIYQPIFN